MLSDLIWLLRQGQMRVAKLKSAYNLIIIKNAVIFKTMSLVLFQWIHLVSGHRCVLGLASQGVVTDIFGVRAGN